MRCTARLIYYKKLSKTGHQRLYRSIPADWRIDDFIGSLSDKIQNSLDLSDMNVCGGKIIAEIGCHEEPGYGEDNTWAEMDISFVCDTCKQTHHPNLPAYESTLNTWLTEIIERL